MNKVNIKLSKNAVLPFYANSDDVGADLTATSVQVVMVGNEPVLMYGTGICVEPPEGYSFELRSRSSIGTKTNLFLTNSIGTIDGGYRGELKFCFGLRGFVMPHENEQISKWVIEGDSLKLRYNQYDNFNGIIGDFVRNFNIYQVGDRIGQLVLMKTEKVDQFNTVTEFAETERGSGGFGSSGK